MHLLYQQRFNLLSETNRTADAGTNQDTKIMHSVPVQLHTQSAMQSAPMPLVGEQHLGPNTSTGCGDGESYWSNILS